MLWAKQLDAVDAWPWMDLAQYIVPDIHVPEDTIKQCLASISQYQLPGLMTRTLIRYLCWSAVSETETVQKFQLPDPFEPYIIACERGM
jgi:hypothetical protein